MNTAKSTYRILETVDGRLNDQSIEWSSNRASFISPLFARNSFLISMAGLPEIHAERPVNFTLPCHTNCPFSRFFCHRYKTFPLALSYKNNNCFGFSKSMLIRCRKVPISVLIREQQNFSAKINPFSFFAYFHDILT